MEKLLEENYRKITILASTAMLHSHSLEKLEEKLEKVPNVKIHISRRNPPNTCDLELEIRLLYPASSLFDIVNALREFLRSKHEYYLEFRTDKGKIVMSSDQVIDILQGQKVLTKQEIREEMNAQKEMRVQYLQEWLRDLEEGIKKYEKMIEYAKEDVGKIKACGQEVSQEKLSKLRHFQYKKRKISKTIELIKKELEELGG